MEERRGAGAFISLCGEAARGFFSHVASLDIFVHVRVHLCLLYMCACARASVCVRACLRACVRACVRAYQHDKQVQEWTKSCEAHQRRASEKLDEREEQVYVCVFTYMCAGGERRHR